MSLGAGHTVHFRVWRPQFQGTAAGKFGNNVGQHLRDSPSDQAHLLSKGSPLEPPDSAAHTSETIVSIDGQERETVQTDEEFPALRRVFQGFQMPDVYTVGALNAQICLNLSV